MALYSLIVQEKLKRFSAVTTVQQTSIAVLSSSTRFDLSLCSPLITSSVHQAPEMINNNQLVDNYKDLHISVHKASEKFQF